MTKAANIEKTNEKNRGNRQDMDPTVKEGAKAGGGA